MEWNAFNLCRNDRSKITGIFDHLLSDPDTLVKSDYIKALAHNEHCIKKAKEWINTDPSQRAITSFDAYMVRVNAENKALVGLINNNVNSSIEHYVHAESAYSIEKSAFHRLSNPNQEVNEQPQAILPFVIVGIFVLTIITGYLRKGSSHINKGFFKSVLEIATGFGKAAKKESETLVEIIKRGKSNDL